MKNRCAWGVTGLVAWCPMMLLSSTQAAPDAKRIFQPLYNQMDRATVRKDVNAITSLYSPDYIGVRENGEKYGFDHVREGQTKLFARYKTIREKTVVQSATVEKGGATIMTLTHAVYVRDSDIPGQEVAITIDSADRDYWVKSSGGWKLKQERHLSSHQTRT